ncbi:hypothetical protein SK128_002169 [Halocaridina rubra]|uniref:C2H2-type domain-containing protein n=1 Tax=Halocaridina rubra TaxID=373956 RepID=A0AAN9ACS2_HALRR
MDTMQAEGELMKMLESDIWAYKAEKEDDFSDDDSDEILEEEEEEESDEEETEVVTATKVEDNNLMCPECHTKFDTSEECALHEKEHEKESNYICDQCGDSFGIKKTLIAHLQKHKVEKKFECDKCHKKFDYRDNLLYHMRIHRDMESHECGVCKEKFRSIFLLEEHKKKHMIAVQDKNNSQRVYLLPVGKGMKGEVFATPITDKPIVPVFACDVCNKKFADKPSLETHKVIHIKHPRGPKMMIRKKGLQPQQLSSQLYICPKCSSRFHNKKSRNAHMAECKVVKSGPHVRCAFCKKMYPNSSVVKNDSPDNMKFICESCCTFLAQKSQVSGFTPRLENRFICNKCDKCFSSEEELRRHIHTHVSEFYYTCYKCVEPQCFLTKKALHEHIITHMEDAYVDIKRVSKEHIEHKEDEIRSEVQFRESLESSFIGPENNLPASPDLLKGQHTHNKKSNSGSHDMESLLCSIPVGQYTKNSTSKTPKVTASSKKFRQGSKKIQTIDISGPSSVLVTELSSNSDEDGSLTSDRDKAQPDVTLDYSINNKESPPAPNCKRSLMVTENPYKKYHTTTSADRRRFSSRTSEEGSSENDIVLSSRNRPRYNVTRPYTKRKATSKCKENSQYTDTADSNNLSTKGTLWQKIVPKLRDSHSESNSVNVKLNIYASDSKETDNVDIELPDYSSDDNNDDFTSDEELKECDVYIKTEVDPEVEENFNMFKNCTVFNPGLGFNIPDAVIKQEKDDKESRTLGLTSIKQEPGTEMSEGLLQIKSERLDESYGDDMTIKEEMETEEPLKEEVNFADITLENSWTLQLSESPVKTENSD